MSPQPTIPVVVTNSDWGNCIINGAASLNCIPGLFKLVLNFAFQIVGVVAIFFVLFAGIKFLTSGGDEKKVEEAKKTLTFAIVGIIVVILSFAIINLISSVTGAHCILNFGFNVC